MGDPEPETFGPLVAITEESLVLLASNIATRCLNAPSSDGKLLERISGRFKIDHVVELGSIKLVIQVLATGWGSGMTPTAARAMESQAATMRLIRSKTKIPVPEICAFDTTSNNEIAAPYLCMSFIPGRLVDEVWFEHPNTFLQEELRLRILKSLSEIMVQFSCLKFDKIGSIAEDASGSTVIGPTYNWDEKEDCTIQVAASGPFYSTSTFFEEHLIATSTKTLWGKADVKVLKTLTDCLPTCDSDFVLCPPRFDTLHILVDDQGTVTGLIGWEFAHTVPRCMGYARYPSWITRDWDPLTYGWPVKIAPGDSPEELGRYREYYNAELGKSLEWQGDWQFTEKSHLVEAIWIATGCPYSRRDICRKFVQVAAGINTEAEAWSVLYDIGAGDYSEKDWKTLKAKFKRLMS